MNDFSRRIRKYAVYSVFYFWTAASTSVPANIVINGISSGDFADMLQISSARSASRAATPRPFPEHNNTNIINSLALFLAARKQL